MCKGYKEVEEISLSIPAVKGELRSWCLRKAPPTATKQMRGILRNALRSGPLRLSGTVHILGSFNFNVLVGPKQRNDILRKYQNAFWACLFRSTSGSTKTCFLLTKNVICLISPLASCALSIFAKFGHGQCELR